MLRIRPEQLAIFEEEALATFREEAALHLQDQHPEACEELGSAGLDAVVREALAEAMSKGIETRGAALSFIELRLMFGKDFELSPDRKWAEKILAHPTLPDYCKLEAIRERMMERTSGLVVRRSDFDPEAETDS
jgi:hypothetical protein